MAKATAYSGKGVARTPSTEEVRKMTSKTFKLAHHRRVVSQRTP